MCFRQIIFNTWKWNLITHALFYLKILNKSLTLMLDLRYEVKFMVYYLFINILEEYCSR